MDLYGRRDPLQGAVTGIFGEVSDVVTTLGDDIIFERCELQTSIFPDACLRSHGVQTAHSTYEEEGPPVLRCLGVVSCTIKRHEQGR